MNLLAIQRVKNWINNLAAEILNKDFLLTDLLELTLHPNGQTAFHAVWLLDTVVQLNLRRFALDIDLFIKYGQRIKHHSCQRHYARIFMFFTASEDPLIQSKLLETDLEPMVELCFDWLINPKVKVAVKASASEVLYNVSLRYDWVKEELQNQLKFLMINGSPAIQARGRRLLHMLKQHNNSVN